MMRQFNRSRFFREHWGKVNAIVILALINLFTIFQGDLNLWFLIPTFFILLPVLRDMITNRLTGEEEEDKNDQEQDTGETAPAAQPRSAQQPIAQKGPANELIQGHLSRARAYQEQINQLIAATADPNSRAQLEALSAQVSDWVQSIEKMARRIDSFQQNTLIHHDLETVPQAIASLEAQLASETDDALRAELERTLATRKSQMAMLKRLNNTMRRAEMKMESTLAALGTIYSQVLTSQSADHVADYSRLSSEVNEEVRTLQDHLEALEEVKLGRG
jgi:hypothetical protein